MLCSSLTMDKLLKTSFRNNKNRVALCVENQKMTYGELLSLSNRIAHALHQYGVGRNRRVALLLPNCMEYVIAEVGIYFSGGTVVGLNVMLGEDDILHILKDSEAKVIFVGEQFIDYILKIKDKLPHLSTVVGVNTNDTEMEGAIPWEEFISGQPDKELEVSIRPTDQSRIMYTGGTTGFPKGAVHCHQTTYLAIISTLLETKINSKDKLLLATPLAHMAYLDLMNGLATGAEIYIQKKFRLKDYLSSIENNKITHLCVVPTMIYRILDFLRTEKYDISSVRTIKYGGSSITTERLKEGLEVFGNVFLQIYGLSETQNCPTWLRKEDHVLDEDKQHLLKSCGKVSYFSEVKIVDDDGNELPPGEVGEIIVNSACSLVEYNNLPEKTSETKKGDWLYTGDLGYFDEDGYLYIMDRKKDMIISGGMNVYSTEVENVLQKHDAVKEVAVIGFPDNDWGEIVTAVIIPKYSGVMEEEIDVFCRKNLAKYKRPKKIIFTDSFPLTRYGKIDKKALRQSFLPI